MSDQWYYSRDGQEQGPVSLPELGQLAANRDLTPDDLVWREGMEDWAPAGQVKSLIAVFKPLAPPASGNKAPGAAARRRGRPGSLGRAIASLSDQPRRLAQSLLVVGIVLVLTARGCDGLGNRNVQRLKAKSDAAQDQFQDEWESRAIPLQSEIEQLREQQAAAREKMQQRRREGPAPTAAELQEYDELLQRLDDDIDDRNETLAEQSKDKAAAKDELTKGAWRDLRIASRDAARNNAMWGYWRELLFVFGSQLLTVGLVILGFGGQGPERWICLIMLAIITFSLYVGGVAWLGSLRPFVGN